MFALWIDELAGLTAAELDQELERAELAARAAEARLAAVTAFIDSRQTYRDHGHRSVKGYLKQQLNCSGARANRIGHRARLLNEYPEAGDALLTGRIGAEQADRLASANRHPRAGDRFQEFARLLLDHAERLEHDEFATAVKHFEIQADEDGAFDDQRFHEEQRAASVCVIDGAIDIAAYGGGPLAAAEMQAVFESAVEAEFQKDTKARRIEWGDRALEHPLPRTTQQRAFDALHQIFLAWAVAPADGKRPEPLVTFVVDPATGLDALARHGLLGDDTESAAATADPAARRCATSSGTPVHSDVVLGAMLRGSVQRVMVDDRGVVINHGRRQRLFTGKAREAAQLLATRCGHRGCDIPARLCDIDHIDEWSRHGGRTDQANGWPMCGVHDRWKHQHQVRGRRDIHGRIHLIRPDGSVIKPVGARDPDWAPDPGTETETAA